MIELNDDFLEQYANASHREQLDFSRKLTFGQKFEMGGLLFDRECKIINAHIKQKMPDVTDELALVILRIVVDFIHGDANFGNQ